MIDPATALSLLGRARDLCCALSADGTLTWVNTAWAEAADVPEAALVGRALADLLHPDDRAVWTAALARGAVEDGTQLRLRRPDGGHRVLAWRALERAADAGLAGLATDVTETLRLRDQMRELERETLGGGWELDLSARRAYWSEGAHAVHETDPGDGPPALETALSHFPPEARELLEPAMARLIATGEPYNLELPFVTARGRRTWVRATARAEMRDGAVARVFGTIREVAAQRERRRRLEELGEVARRTESLVAICDAQGRLTWVNAAFERVSGWTLAEAVGRKPGDFLQCAETDPATVADIRAALAARSGVRVQIENEARDGRRYWIDLDIRPTFDDAGALTGWIAVSSDITGQRERARRLEALSREAETARAQLVAAVEALPDAFAWFDAEDRLMLCNRRYRELYAASAPAIVLGARFEDILRYGLARGQYLEAVGREEEWLAERLAAHRADVNQQEQRLPDGRWLRVIEQATPDGGRVGLRVDVTRAKTAEQRLADILRGAKAGTWEWKVRTGEARFNARWAGMLGRTLDELGATSVETWNALIHPDDRRRSDEALDRHFRGETDFYECEARMRHKDGSWVWVLDRGRVASRTADGAPEWMYGIQLDITQRKTAEAALAASEERFRTLFDALPDGVILVDAETRRVRAFNPAAPRMLGHSRRRTGALRIDQVEGLGGREGVRSRVERILREGREDFETLLRRPDGSAIPVAVTVMALRGGERPELLAVMRDISAFRRQTEELERARAEAEAANAAKSRFLANMSHEIRTPMNGVMGMAEALARGLNDPGKRRMAETIRRSGEALLTVLNDILDFSKIEAGRLTLEQAPFSPLELVERVEAAHGPLAAQKGVRLTIRTDAGAARLRRGDSVRVLQILHNLLSNAIKFTVDGSVRLTVEGDPRRPLRIVVRDTGIGMTEEQIGRLFETFAQADASTTRRFGGAGLGMSIVRSLVDLMGGSISVESRPGEGARVAVELPLPPVEGELPAPPACAAQDPEARIEGMRVLAVDDNEINRLVLAQMLGALGVEALIVEGGREAVDAAAAGRFDAILMDISMPEMDGEQALAMIRAQERASDRGRTPMIAVTANAFPHQIAGYLAAGFDGHVAKPLSLDALRRGLAAAAATAGKDVPDPAC